MINCSLPEPNLRFFSLRQLLAYLMIPIIQKQLEIFKVWNSHRIRAQRDTRSPDGVPNHIYAFPEEYGLEDCGMYKSSTQLYLGQNVKANGSNNI